MEALESYTKLDKYCEGEDYSGWDPYDGLNSKLFQLSRLGNSPLFRLILIQGLKRSPINLRPILLVHKEHNAKGIGLFLTAYSKILNLVKKSNSHFGEESIIENKIHYLAELLINLQSTGYSGACWGYNFDWQARRLFLFPKNTPTVVATTFCATALMDAYEATGIEKYLEVGLSSGQFVLNNLNRTKHNQGFLFSYSPIQGNDTVYNASLLGTKLLSHCYKYTLKDEYAEVARLSALACATDQKEDGSWVYGLLPIQNWIDSFHTGYNLDGYIAYQNFTKDFSFSNNIEKGFDFYIDNFFQANGIPNYYHNRLYPIDIHCPAQLLVTLNRLGKFANYKNLAERVLGWTLNNMQDPKGYFYYQIKKRWSTKIPFMRWSNAFMLYAFAHYFESKQL
jgi:hypothetical protein